MVQITRVVERPEKRSLIFQDITSKGWVLFGYTIPNKVTQTYKLNRPGRRWVEHQLIPELSKKAEKKSNNANKDLRE